MGIINVTGIRIRAYHGCMPEENVVGNEYIVDVVIDTDFSAASDSDKLEDTVDYCIVYDCVLAEMKIPSKLIEHVGKRIIGSLRKKYPGVKTFSVTVKKIAPPIRGVVDSVSVVVNG
jgi:7,8-dihydroneopterin aldolase/epimerase/oxygenase